MNVRFGKFLGLFFATCFLALQCNVVGEVNLAQSTMPIFHIEDVSYDGIDKRNENTFIHLRIFQSKQANLTQQKAKHSQMRQLFWAFEQHLDLAFRLSLQECLSATCVDYQNKLVTNFNYLQKLKLSFDFNPIISSNFKQVHSDESDSQISLS